MQARDKGGVFPGCRHTRFVDAHHIKHWSAGGETNLENLMLLCSRHHRLVHEGGFRIDKDYRDRWVFKRPDGIAVPSCGYRPEDTHDDDVDTISTLINNPSAEGLLTTVKNSQPERLPATLADRSPAQI
ncbi:MAG: HNH endonuclease [Woeseiaceae bacterium]|nr:HNH endonuclease [Woeseiaceae bacterium]